MAEMTIDQQRALAMANARLRLQEQPVSDEKTIQPGKAEPDAADRLMANPLIRFATEAAAPFIGTTQKLIHAISPEMGKWYDERFVDRPKQMVKRADPEGSGISAGDVAGFAGAALNPVSLTIGKALPLATSGVDRVKQGMLMGGAYGATAPVEKAEDDFWEKAITQTGVSTVLGGLVPIGWEGAKLLGRGIRNVAQPFMGQSGIDKATGRLANIAAGDKRDDVIDALIKSKDFVPGSKLTAGQASVPANSAEFAALGDIASKTKPSAYYGPKGIEGEQEAAKLAQIRIIRGGDTDAPLESAIAKRAAAVKPAYEAVDRSKQKVDVFPVLDKIDDYLVKNKNEKTITTPLKEIRKALDLGEDTPLVEQSPQALVSLSKGIKEMIGKKTPSGQNEYDVKVLSEIKRDLDKQIESAEVAYRLARTIYRQKSVPVNQMAVGRELEDKLLNPSGKETAGSYLHALDDSSKILKDATGFKRYKNIESVLLEKTPIARGIASDLENNLVYKNLASKGMESAKERVGNVKNFYKGMGILERGIVITNAIMNRIEGKIGNRTAQELSLKMQDPKDMARIMEAAKPFERQAIVDALMKQQGTAAGYAATGGN